MGTERNMRTGCGREGWVYPAGGWGVHWENFRAGKADTGRGTKEVQIPSVKAPRGWKRDVKILGEDAVKMAVLPCEGGCSEGGVTATPHFYFGDEHHSTDGQGQNSYNRIYRCTKCNFDRVWGRVWPHLAKKGDL